MKVQLIEHAVLLIEAGFELQQRRLESKMLDDDVAGDVIDEVLDQSRALFEREKPELIERIRQLFDLPLI